jgi:hypothetical protein
MHKYRRKSVMFLMGYLGIFFIVMVISIVNLNRGVAFFDIGMAPVLQNWIILIFSLLAMIKVVIDIASIESHAEYDRKLRQVGSRL